MHKWVGKIRLGGLYALLGLVMAASGLGPLEWQFWMVLILAILVYLEGLNREY